MAVREILLYPKDKVALRAKSEPITVFNQQTRELIKDLKDTLLAHHEGIGLAAPQIDAHLRVVLVRLGASHLLPAVERENKRYSLLSMAVVILVAVVIVFSKGSMALV